VRAGDLEPLRERLYDTMWQRVGILRDASGLAQALAGLEALEAELADSGVGDTTRAFNLAWHDWLNLQSLIAVSRAITQAAAARQESRGAHYREDFPHTGSLEASAYTSIRADGSVTMKPVAFTRVRPGQSLLKHAA
jgi:fumarate reductase flavoprotein subunit